MKDYIAYMDNISVDNEFHEKIMKRITQNPQPLPRKRMEYRYAGLAACAAVLALGFLTIPRLFTDTNRPINDTVPPNLNIANDPVPTNLNIVNDPLVVANDDDVPNEVNPRVPESETGMEQIVEQISGIYIPAIELPENTGGAAMDMVELFVYKGRIYTKTSSYYNGEATRYIRENLVGERIGYVTGSIDEWSTQDAYAVEFAGSVWGDVYEVKGYNDFLPFRFCMFGSYEEAGHTVEWVHFYENLSGFYLDYGIDFFGYQRLNMAGNWNKVMYQKRNGRDIYNELPDVTDDDIEAFIDELYNCRFGDFNEAFGVNGYEHKKQVLLCFYMNDHTVVELLLVEGGYVNYRCMLGTSAGYFVQMPGEAFDKVFNACIRE